MKKRQMMAASAGTLALAVTGAVAGGGQAWSAHDGGPVPALAAADGGAVVSSPDGPANLRNEPGLPRPDRQGTNLMTTVEAGTSVRVHCVVAGQDKRAPGDWLFVTLLDGPWEGVSGYLHSSLVLGAGTPQACTGDVVAAHPFTPGELTLAQGPASDRGGFWYDVTLSGATPNHTYRVSCHDDADPISGWVYETPPFWSFDLRTDAAGNARTTSGCFSGEGERHWVSSGPYGSGFVTWVLPAVS